MQVYDVLDVLTARPPAADLARVPHHLYGHVDPRAAYSTGLWMEDAARKIADIRARGALPIVVGGTGLYFQALTGGLSDMPEIPRDIRQTLRDRLEAEGVAPLHAELGRLDPDMAARLGSSDRQRIVRALEVITSTGRSISAYQELKRPAVVDADRTRRIVLVPDRQLLHARINARFEKMVELGALDEVKRLLALEISPLNPAMKAIGVAPLSAFLAGRMTMERAIERASAATRQYAKRQLTWFRNQLGPEWERIQS